MFSWVKRGRGGLNFSFKLSNIIDFPLVTWCNTDPVVFMQKTLCNTVLPFILSWHRNKYVSFRDNCISWNQFVFNSKSPRPHVSRYFLIRKFFFTDWNISSSTQSEKIRIRCLFSPDACGRKPFTERKSCRFKNIDQYPDIYLWIGPK